MGLALLLLLAILVARAIYGVVARACVHFVLPKGGRGGAPLSACSLAAPPTRISCWRRTLRAKKLRLRSAASWLLKKIGGPALHGNFSFVSHRPPGQPGCGAGALAPAAVAAREEPQERPSGRMERALTLSAYTNTK